MGMETKKREFSLTLSHGSKVPCLWEGGGGYTNTGWARVIAGKNGQKKNAIYVRRSGSLACENHALIPIEVGDYVILASHHRHDYEITIWRIAKIDLQNLVAEGEAVCSYEMGEWYPEHPIFLQQAIDAAWDKASCYHCRGPHYVQGYQSCKVC